MKKRILMFVGIIAMCFIMTACNKKYTVTWKNYDGTVLEIDEKVKKGTMPSYDAAIPIKDEDAQYTYIFAGWTKEIVAVTEDVTYTAQFSPIIKTYTVTWKNYDGTILEIDSNVPYGTYPSYDGTISVPKDSNEQYSYKFIGWTKEIVAVTEDVTYTAQFSSTIKTYTVTWKNWDETVLEVDYNVKYGTTPSYNGLTPKRSSGTFSQYEYIFSGWSPNISDVTGNIVYVAKFQQVVKSYTVTWANFDGTILEVDSNVKHGTTPNYNGLTPEKSKDAQYEYIFSGWSPTISSVTGDVTYIAQYYQVEKGLTVTWKNWDGTILEVDSNVKHGTIPNYNGLTPEKSEDAQYEYIFSGWSPNISSVTGNVTYTAQFQQVGKTYTVTWKNWDGTILEVDSNVKYGTIPNYNGLTPEKSNTNEYEYKFSGWSPNISSVTGNVTYTAQFKQIGKTYTVTWVNFNGAILEIDNDVEYGTLPVYNGITPTRVATSVYTFEFSGWSPIVSSVTGDITYTAQYSRIVNKYTVTWKNYDGTVLEVDYNVEADTVPIYNSATPSKESTGSLTYEFIGWSPEVDAIRQDVTYIAQFIELENKYTVTWLNWDGEVLEIDYDVEYGTMPSYDGKTPTKDASADEIYSFNEWNPELVEVSCDCTYTATFVAKSKAVLALSKIRNSQFRYEGSYSQYYEQVGYSIYDDAIMITESNEYEFYSIQIIFNENDMSIQKIKFQYIRENSSGAYATVNGISQISTDYSLTDTLTLAITSYNQSGISINLNSLENNFNILVRRLMLILESKLPVYCGVTLKDLGYKNI